MLIAGFIFLVIGGKLTVDGAVSIARQMGISEFLISSTIVAAGTSLPELVTSVAAALQKGDGHLCWKYCRLKYFQYIFYHGSFFNNISSNGANWY